MRTPQLAPAAVRTAPTTRAVRATRTALAVLAVALAAGCTINLGDPTVGRSDVEQQIISRLAPGLGAAPRSASCPGDLTGKVGVTMQCTLVTAAGDTRTVSVKVTSVTDAKVNFHLEAAPATEPVSPAPAAPTDGAAVPSVDRENLEPKIVELLTPQLGAAPKYAVCPENLRGEIGTELQCQIVDADGLERQVLVTVSSVEGTTVDFTLKVIS